MADQGDAPRSHIYTFANPFDRSYSPTPMSYDDDMNDSLEHHPDIADIVAHTHLDWPSTFDSLDESAHAFSIPSSASSQTTTQSDISVVPETLDFRNLDYVDTPPESLICTICVTPLINPVQLPCEHTFCSECLDFHFDTIHTDLKTCPKCRGLLDPKTGVKSSPRIIRQMLDDLLVKCPSLGCKKELARDLMKDHVEKYCDFAHVQCPHPDCISSNQGDQRSFIQCAHPLERCPDCANVVLKDGYQAHLETCEDAMRRCNLCFTKLPRSKMAQHEQEECLAVETSCPGLSLGCTFRAQREQTNIHTTTCMLAMINTRLDSERAERKAEIEALQSTVDAQAKELRGMDRLKSKMNILEHGLDRINQHLFDDDGKPKALHASTAPSTLELISSDAQQIKAELDQHLTHQDEVNAVHFSRIEELDARMQMCLANETLRWQQEILGLGAAVTAVRGQLNTLASLSLRPASLAAAAANAAARRESNLDDQLSPTSATMPIRRFSSNSVTGDGAKL